MKVNPILINDVYKKQGLGLFEDTRPKIEASFKDLFMEALNNTNKLEMDSEKYAVKLATGELENIHEAMIAAQKAEVSLQFITQVRNKVLDAYREITRMQI